MNADTAQACRRPVFARLLLASLLFGWLTICRGADRDTAEVMRQKLQYSQAVLRGIALQDFVVVKTNAQQLVNLSKLSGWQARQGPEYELFSVEFRRRAEALVEAAEAKNVDAATLAYTQLTFSCVSCHKYLRSGSAQKVLFRLPPPSATTSSSSKVAP
ncbi:MAG TPA: hypothetical protein PLX89_18025 [Verrucomicrobiota bacterium]|nr:hypothetical protein [Verrucomicrobiota bacterium]